MLNNRSQCLLTWLIVLVLSRLTTCANVTTDSSSFDVFKYVNQLIGTDNGGEQAVKFKPLSVAGRYLIGCQEMCSPVRVYLTV